MFDYGFSQSEFAIRLIGNFGVAGTVEFSLAGQVVDSVLLPKGEWAVMAILAATALEAPVQSIEAYHTSKQLAARLKKKSIIKTGDQQIAIRAVSRLRKRLRTLKIATLLSPDDPNDVLGDDLGDVPFDFANVLIERSNLLGYRLNISPADLQLEFLETSH